MSGIVTGIAAMREAVKTRPKLEKIDFFKLDDGKSVMVRFLQEIDKDSEYYVEENGLGFLAYVLSPPTADGWKYRYVVNEDNEHLLEDVGDWDRKGRLFINLEVNVGTEDEPVWKPQLWDASKAVLRQLLEWSDDLGGITQKEFKISRNGSGTSTTYILMPKKDVPAGRDVTAHTLVDAEDRLLTVLTAEEIARFATSDDDDENSETVEWVT